MLFDHPACEQCPPRVGEKSLLVAPRHSPRRGACPPTRRGRGKRETRRISSDSRSDSAGVTAPSRSEPVARRLVRSPTAGAGAELARRTRVNIPNPPRPPRPPVPSQQSFIAAAILSATLYVIVSAFWQVSARRNLADGAVAAPTG